MLTDRDMNLKISVESRSVHVLCVMAKTDERDQVSQLVSMEGIALTQVHL